MLLLLSVFIGSLTYAQVLDSIVELEEIRIYSSRVDITPEKSGRQIYLVNNNRIKSLPVQSIDELLRYLPAVEVQSRGPFGTQSDISLRGSTFNQVLVLIDGLRLNDPLTGHFNSNLPVSIEEIERVEIIHGPSAAVYGPDAVGGIIHIITKSFADISKPDHLEGQISGMAGEYGLWHMNSGIFLKKKKIRIGAGTLLNTADGHFLTPDTLRGDFTVSSSSFSVGVNPNQKIDIAFRTSFDNRNFNSRYFYTRSPYDLSREQIKQWWNQARLKYRMNSRHVSEIQFCYKTTRDSFLFNPSFPANIHRTIVQNLQFNHYISVKPGLKVTAGVQIDKKGIESTDRGNHHTTHMGSYLSGYVYAFSGLSILTSMRMDYEKVYGLQILPQLSLAYKTGKVNIRGVTGRSIRAADFTERFISNNLAGPISPGRNIGNPYLEAEKAWSYEFGLDYQPLATVMLHSTVFHRFSNDLIDFVLTNERKIPEYQNLLPDAEYFYSQNISRLKTIGYNAIISFITPFGQNAGLDLNFGYSFVNSKSDSLLISKYIANHSNHVVNGYLQFYSNNLNISINAIWKNRNADEALSINQELKPCYMVWNTKMDVNIWKSNVFLTIQMNNLFNEEYSDVLGAEMPGRWIMGGLTWKFSRGESDHNRTVS